MRSSLGDYLAEDGIFCRPLFDFVCEIDTLWGALIVFIIFLGLQYLLFRLLAKSKVGRFFIGLTFVVYFPLISFFVFKDSFF